MKDIKALFDLFKKWDVSTFAGGLKAQNMKARGNAPGNDIQNILRPEGARQVFRRIFVSPFQGGNSSRCLFPGRCPGLSCDCTFSARDLNSSALFAFVMSRHSFSDGECG